jgi:hypothetical protein
MARVLQVIQIILSTLALGVLVFLAHSPDELALNASKWAKWLGEKNPPHWLVNHSFDHYAGICLIVFVVLVWFVPYIFKRRAKPFEIIYDPENVGRQFRELKTVGTAPHPIHGVEYRIKIRNNTAKTVEEVKITSERIGLLGELPIRLIFDENKQKTHTLDPNTSAFVYWFFVPLPLAQPGTLMRETASAAYGPLRVVVSAKDTKAVGRLFRFAPITLDFDPYAQSLVI